MNRSIYIEIEFPYYPLANINLIHKHPFKFLSSSKCSGSLLYGKRGRPFKPLIRQPTTAIESSKYKEGF